MNIRLFTLKQYYGSLRSNTNYTATVSLLSCNPAVAHCTVPAKTTKV